ncbi:MAG: AIPR family protein [Oscillospiraceae bacterium]|nr:AIPR family protein [Oscillospiraceae bacterium]
MAENTFETFRKEIEGKGVFDEVKCNVYDSTKITDACRSIKRSIKKTVPIKNYSTLPSIDNVIESFIGTVKCKDYVELITNNDGLLLTHLFEDNVRYYQGRNKVNSEMFGTIADPQQQQAFALLNNGITIIAKEIRRTGDNFVIEDFQIVNGCQTSFVLYENRKKLSDDSYVAVKLISSTDKGVIDSIVKTTNSQTLIVDEAFETLKDFHKDLETVYGSYGVQHRLFYERRSKQYDFQNVSQNKVVSFPSQTAAYVAMFLGQPQSTHRYYGELLKSNKTKIYQDEDIKEQYCIASMYAFFIDKYLRDNGYDRNYRLSYKYHIALLCRVMVSGNEIPKANSREMKALCQKLYEHLKETAEFELLIKNAINVIDSVAKTYESPFIGGNHLSRLTDKI